ncbi:hypothetical protein Q1695_001036 [Nippostrongylus brasiliensis]|nr:hypothetical protein Q1695_001036 [Nippostrongylus brasiliensis]
MDHRPLPLDNHMDPRLHECEGEQLYSQLNVDQRAAADEILLSFSSAHSKLHFIDGPGGSGKTFLYNALYHICKGRGYKVISVAWTGIAANLLPEGRTACSTFKLSVASDNRVCSMNTTSPEARQIRESELIIWDEISMVPKFALDAVDVLLKELMNNNSDFGGKTVVLGGDFRQVLPIIERGGDAAMVDASVKNSALWPRLRQHRLRNNMRAATSGPSWCQFLLSIGNGEVEEDDGGRIELPTDLKSCGDLLAEVFGDLIPETTRTYESIEELISDDTAQTDFTTKFLNSLSLVSLPSHALKLWGGAIEMLLRNLDVRRGLCNGTRLIVCDLGRFVLRCRFAVGPRRGEAVLIPRIDAYAERGLPFRLRRRQFPLRLAFAMTIVEDRSCCICYGRDVLH